MNNQMSSIHLLRCPQFWLGLLVEMGGIALIVGSVLTKSPETTQLPRLFYLGLAFVVGGGVFEALAVASARAAWQQEQQTDGAGGPPVS